MKINTRLTAVKKKAQLTISDLGVWFNVDRRTMQTWLAGVEPHACRHEQLNELLEQLDKAITSGEHFPVPLYVNQYHRKAYILKVRDAVSGRVSSARSAKRRV